MSFHISHQQLGGLPLLSLYDDQTDNTVSILPGAGAALHSWEIPLKGQYHELLDGYRDLSHLQEELALSYRGSKLSPFACRIANGQYTYRGQLFEFPEKFVDGSAIHGFLFNTSFDVVDIYQDDEQASVLLKYLYPGDKAAFPFRYRCEIRYTLMTNQRLKVETTIINLSDQDLPLQDGWHPYFSLGGSINDYQIQWQTAGKLVSDSKLIPTGVIEETTLFHESARLGDLELDTCFLLNEDILGAAVTVHQSETGLTFEIFPSEQYPFLQVYTPPNRKSIAIENLSGAPNCFNNKMGLILLPPGQAETFTVHYQVRGNQ